MKCFYVFALSLWLSSLVAAIPVQTPDDKGKGRADPQPPSRPNTPTPENDPTVPLPGRSGTHTDPKTKMVTMYYGDDRLPEHMGHLQRNQAEFPHNRNPMSLSNSDSNRNNALRNIPMGGSHPVTKLPLARDEKMPNMLDNPRHATSTTVEYVHLAESNREGGQLNAFREAMKAAGPNAQGKLRPNPGWLPLDPNQRRGHEAPAKLKTQTLADGSSFKKPPPPGSSTGSTKSSQSSKTKAAQKVQNNQSKAGPVEAKLTGYTPVVGSSEMKLRDRKGAVAPPPRQPKEKKPAQAGAGASNLRPGNVAPPGKVWKPTDGASRASHFGAPGPLRNAENRQPPRPQNRDQYMKQLKETKAVEDKSKKVLPKQTANLAKFEKMFGPAKMGDGSGRRNEAPARMQTQAKPQPPSRPPTPGPKPGPSNSKPGPSNPKPGPSNPKPGPSNPKPGPSNPKPGPSNPKPGPSGSKSGSSKK